jgi:hypothetical protein
MFAHPAGQGAEFGHGVCHGRGFGLWHGSPSFVVGPPSGRVGVVVGRVRRSSVRCGRWPSSLARRIEGCNLSGTAFHSHRGRPRYSGLKDELQRMPRLYPVGQLSSWLCTKLSWVDRRHIGGDAKKNLSRKGAKARKMQGSDPQNLALSLRLRVFA